MFEEYERESRRRDSVRDLGSKEQITRFGPGATHEVGHVAELLAVRKALLVVDPGLIAHEGAKLVETVLRRANILTTPFVHFSHTPLATQAQAAAAIALKTGCDGIISYGGGAALDIGKAASVIEEGRSVYDYGHGRDVVRQRPHIALPTTAGTGAESSPYAFFLQEQGHEHTILEGPDLIPSAAIVDPLSHLSMRPELTASSGINSLADAIEALLGQPSEADTEAAVAAIEAIWTDLPRAVAHPQDLEARTSLAEASYQAGRAYCAAGLGMMDSISLVLSAIYSVGQSEANAMVLPHVLRHQVAEAPERFARLAKVIPGAGEAGQVPDAVQSFIHSVGLRKSLHDMGLNWDDIYLCAHAILAHPLNVRDPHRIDAQGLADVLAAALEVQQAP